MESPCRGCERESLDKNECIGWCAKIIKFQNSLEKTPINFDNGYSSFLNGATRKTPKPTCL